MKAIFWLVLGLLNFVGIILNLSGIGSGDLMVVIVQMCGAIYCIGEFLSEVEE